MRKKRGQWGSRLAPPINYFPTLAGGYIPYQDEETFDDGITQH